MLLRVLQLPVVSGTCECFQKTYTSTKEAHPLVASVCNAYEKGVQGASSLAAWSMEPVVRRLSTQCEFRHLAAARLSPDAYCPSVCLPVLYQYKTLGADVCLYIRLSSSPASICLGCQ